MDSESADAVVWIGLVTVVPREACELLSANKEAYVNFLALAKSDSEYRAKVMGALSYYGLELLQFENTRPLKMTEDLSEDILEIAEELGKNRNPQHVRYGSFHTFPRIM